MSATNGLNNRAVSSSAELVSQQILGVNQQIQGLGQDLVSLGNEVRNLVAQLQALQPPAAPGAGASDEAMRAYQQAMSEYQAKVNQIRGQIDALNAKSQQIANKISELQNKVRRLEGSDLPAAQRNDAERQERELKMAREQYEAIAKAIDTNSSKNDADVAAKREVIKKQMRVGHTAADTSSTADQRMTLRVQWRNNEVKLNDSSDLKTLVRAFSMHLTVMGDTLGTGRNPAIGMPRSPGSGLPDPHHIEGVSGS